MGTCRYPWILKNYANTRITDTRTNMSADTGRIFIQRIVYKRTITRTLPILLTSLVIIIFSKKGNLIKILKTLRYVKNSHIGLLVGIISSFSFGITCISFITFVHLLFSCRSHIFFWKKV